MRWWLAVFALLGLSGCADSQGATVNPLDAKAAADEVVAGMPGVGSLDTVIAAPIVRDGSRILVPTTLHDQPQSSRVGSAVWTFTYIVDDDRPGTYAVTVDANGVVDHGYWGGAFNQVGSRADLASWRMSPSDVLDAVSADGTHVWSLHVAHARYTDEVVWAFTENRELRIVVDSTGEILVGRAALDYNMPPNA